MLTVFLTVLPIFALIAAGYGFARIRGLGRDAVSLLTAFVVWLALPALLFRSMAEARFADVWQPGFLIAFGSGMALAFVLGMIGARSLTGRALDGLTAGYANATFLGIPIAVALVGPETGLAAAILATLLTVCLLFAVTVGMAEYDRHRGAGLGATLGKAFVSMLRNPLVFSPLVGGLWGAAGLPMPAPLHRFTDLLGMTAAPCALVCIGMFLAQRPAGEGAASGRRLAPLIAIKLVVQPAVTALIAFGLLDMPRDWAVAAVLIAAQPTGTGPFMLAELYGQEARLASRAILFSTILSVVTVTVVATALR